MKSILLTFIILIFILFHAAGQQPQDTIYLKDGSKVSGKLVEKSKQEIVLQSLDGKVFVFTSEHIEKIIPAVTFDTLSIDEERLNKAVKLRNTGRILTLGGLGLTGGSIIWAAAGGVYIEEYKGAIVIISGLIGIAATFVGLPVWVVGSHRKAKAEITLEKLPIEPEGSMALGLGITIRF